MTQDFNQDDAFNTRNVETSAFGPPDAAAGEDTGPQSTPAKKPFPVIKALCGLFGLFFLFVAVVVIFGPKVDDDASYDQVSGSGTQAQGFEQPSNPNQNAMPAAQQQLAPAGESGVVPEQAEDPFATLAGVESAGSASNDVPTTAPSEVAVGTAAPVVVPAPTPSLAPTSPAAPAANAPSATAPSAVVRDDVAILAGQVESLRGDVDRLRNELAEQRRSGRPTNTTARPAARPVRAAATAAAPAAPSKVEGMTLKAIVDQNAWLQTSNGESVMVSPGDSVPGGGAVKSVDPDSGVVHLVDGRVIR